MTQKRRSLDVVVEFLKMETTGGVLLVLASILAMVLANTGFAPAYDAFLEIPASNSDCSEIGTVKPFGIKLPRLATVSASSKAYTRSREQLT